MAPDPCHPSTLTLRQQFTLTVGIVGVLAGFLTAASVRPDPRGYGSHQQFGLPPCSFYSLFGIPCPSCGGTTCAAHYVRGQWISAFRSNPAVFVLMLASSSYVFWAASCLVRRRMWGISDPIGVAVWTLIGLSGLAIVQWVLRLAGV